MNPHEGAVLLEHAGRTAKLQFTWRAIETIRAEWGADYAKRMDEAMNGPVLGDLSYLIAVTGDMPQADVMTWSPPIMASNAALATAWRAAWFGPETPETKDAAANPPKALKRMQEALSGLQWWRPSAQASPGVTSGA